MKQNLTVYNSVAILAALTLSAYFLADTLDTVIGMRLASASPIATASQELHLPALAKKQLSDYASVLDSGLFGDGKAPSAAPAPVAALAYKLVGTIEGGPFAGAVLALDNGQEFYRINRKMPDGSMITAVMRNSILLKRADGSVVPLDMPDDTKIIALQTKKSAGSDPDIKKISNGKFLVDQREVLASTQNMGQLLTQAQAVPFVEQGKISGFQINRIVPGSLYEKIGLQNGDVIKQINSQALDDPGKFFQLYQGLREERNITIDIVRGGQRLTMNYEIR